MDHKKCVIGLVIGVAVAAVAFHMYKHGCCCCCKKECCNKECCKKQ